MKKYFFCILFTIITLNCNAQFLQGFLSGAGQALQNAARQQNNYKQQQTQQKSEDNYHESRIIEDDGFEWIRIDRGYTIQGAKSSTGSILIPLSKEYDLVVYHQNEGTGYFSVSKDGKEGIYNLSGRELIPVSRGYTFVIMDNCFGEKYYRVEKGGMKGLCDANGREIISSNRGYTSISVEEYLGVKYYGVEKDNSKGMCDANGREIISTNRGYSFICFHEEEGNKSHFGVYKGNKKGVCDITGKEIIPCIYESLIFTDKFEYKDNAGKWIATNVSLDSNGHGLTLESSASSITQNNSYEAHSNSPQPYCLQTAKHYKITKCILTNKELPFEADICVTDNAVVFVTGDGKGGVEDMNMYYIEKIEKLSTKYQYKLSNGYLNVSQKTNSIAIALSVDGKTNVFIATTTPYSQPTLRR